MSQQDEDNRQQLLNTRENDIKSKTMKAAELQKEFEQKMALEEEALRKEELMLKVEERKQKN